MLQVAGIACRRESKTVAPKDASGSDRNGGFVVFGACMALLASITLTWPGTPLDQSWKVNPHAHDRLAPLGRTLDCFSLHSRWLLAYPPSDGFSAALGWLCATVLIAAQILGDVINAASGKAAEGLLGATIAGALLVYPLRSTVRGALRLFDYFVLEAGC